ncbi:MAG: hypothetical protein FWH29_02305 [Methanobrevibacter sp.]|nr:hypothetical protein [Methanobrevibacter sp.]
MDETQKIKINDHINSSLELNSAATEFFENVNQLSENMIEIDFENIIFMSRAFTQEYVAQKIKTQKDIKEVNISKDILLILRMVEKSFGIS